MPDRDAPRRRRSAPWLCSPDTEAGEGIVIRRIVLGGALAVGLIVAPSASAGTVPIATLAKKADAICKADNASVAHFKHQPPNMDRLFVMTSKQLKATAGYWAEVLALSKSEVTRIFALGTPSEPAARKAWTRWHTLTTSYGLPFMESIAAAAKRGDMTALKKAFSGGDKQDAEAAKLIKGLGMKVCEFI
jgi:hypothetical protein